MQQQQGQKYPRNLEDIAMANSVCKSEAEALIDILPSAPFHYDQGRLQPPDGDEDDLVDARDDENDFEEDLDASKEPSSDFIPSEPPHLPLVERQSQLSIQLSAASSVNSSSFVAPQPIIWDSRDDISLKWLPDGTNGNDPSSQHLRESSPSQY